MSLISSRTLVFAALVACALASGPAAAHGPGPGKEWLGEEMPLPPAAAAAPPAAAEPSPAPRFTVTVSGTIAGGGTPGPGGAVVWLKRASGETPRPAPARGKVVSQRGKLFVPHVLAVPVGTKVDFRNEDTIYHNVFSLTKPNDFDTGLYKQGGSYE